LTFGNAAFVRKLEYEKLNILRRLDPNLDKFLSLHEATQCFNASHNSRRYNCLILAVPIETDIKDLPGILEVKESTYYIYVGKLSATTNCSDRVSPHHTQPIV